MRCHALRVGVVLEVVSDELGKPGVGLRDEQETVWPDGGHLGHDRFHLVRSAPAVGADRRDA